MKLKIKVKRINSNIEIPQVIDKGEWVDLKAGETITLNAPQAGVLRTHKVGDERVSHRDVTFDSKLIGLGIAMQLPKGYEATILARSSTFKNWGIITANGMGIVDSSYCGNTDEWKYSAISFSDTTINEGDRICQFRIQLSQKATIWQKIKWLFTTGIKFVEVGDLNNPERGGIGSTGIK